jgi:tetratricopeptide (TPR) repeat protein
MALVHYSAAYELSAAENSPESIYASLRLSELQVQAGQLSDAERTLRSAANKPVLTLLHLQAIAKLLAVLKQQDKLPEIKASATGLQPRLFRLASEMPDAIEPWQALVDVASQAENYQEADDYIQSALAMAKEPNTRRGLLQLRAAVLMRRAMQMRDVEKEARYLEKFGYLATAVAVDPTNDKLYLAMLEYADLSEQIPGEDDFLRLALGSGKTPGVVHVILGIRDAQRNEKLSAYNHWDIADTQTDRAEWLVGMFSRLLLQAKTLDTTEYFQYLDLCQGHYEDQPMLGLARAEALLLLQQDAATAVTLLEKLIAENENFMAAREAYVTALKALGRTEDAEREALKLKELFAELQKQQGKTSVGKEDESKSP